MRKYLYLSIEISVRELDSKLLLALFALKDGYTTIVGQDYFFTKNLPRLPVGVFFDKSFSKNHYQKHLRIANERGCSVVGIDEEGGNCLGIWSINRWKLRNYKKAVKCAQKIFTWGPYQHNKLCKIYPKYKEKIIKTGSQRWDLLRPEGIEFYSDKAAAVKKQFGDFILVNLSVLIGRSVWRDKPMPHEGYQSIMLKEVLELTKELSKRYPSTIIIFRLHPREIEALSLKYLSEVFADYPNVVINNDGVAEGWILASALTVVTDCTTGAQASLMKQPVVSYLNPSFSFDEKVKSCVTSLLCPQAQTVDEVIDKVERTWSGDLAWFTDVSLPRESLVLQHFEALDGPLACQKMMSEINKVQVIPKDDVLQIDSFDLKSESELARLKFPDPGFDEVQRRLHRLNKCYDLNLDFQVSQIRPKVYLVEGAEEI